MDEIEKLVHKIQAIYDEMGAEFSRAQNQSGLLCLEGCGECCLNQGVEATVLEMLPLAFELFHRGEAEDFLTNLLECLDQSCVLYHRDSSDGKNGYCSEYRSRPNLCRQFGTSAWHNKGSWQISVCKKIKSLYPELTELVQKDAEKFPKMTEWSYKVITLHPILGNRVLPINKAIKEALEFVLARSAYL